MSAMQPSFPAALQDQRPAAGDSARIRVLYVLPSAHIGGAETITREWIVRHAPAFEPLVAVGGDGPLVRTFAQSGVPVTRLRPWRQRAFLRQTLTVARVILRQRVDLVHSAMLWGHLVGGLAGWLTRRPVICFNHGPIGSQRLQGLAPFLPAARVLVPSRYMCVQQNRYWFNTRQFAVLPLGLDAAVFRPPSAGERRQARAALGLADDECVVGIFGRIVPLKGHALLIEALAGLAAEPARRFVLLCVGDASGAPGEVLAGHRAEIAARAAALPARMRVVFTGFREDVRGCLGACDIMANSSLEPETFGLAIAEAMLTARVVVVPDCGGPAEYVREGATGFTYRLGDVATLRAALRRAGEAGAEIGARAREVIQRDYSVDASVKRLEGHYREVLAEVDRGRTAFA